MNWLRRFYRKHFFDIRVTKGYGLFERFLAMQRTAIAHKCISEHYDDVSDCRVLDVGCGIYPIYLLTSKFMHKYGLDNVECSNAGVHRRVKYLDYDIEAGGLFAF